jgi:hypothetical protein
LARAVAGLSARKTIGLARKKSLQRRAMEGF